MARSCQSCIHFAGAIIAGEEREHLTPCWYCGDYYSNYVNKYCSTCKYKDMNGEDDTPPCGECGEAYSRWEQGEEE